MRVQFTDQNFEEQVIKASSAMPVLVDFHADWCVAPGTDVLLEDGSQTQASRIIPGQKLPGLGTDGVTLGSVVKSKVTRDSGHCQEIVLDTGRKVKVTDQHLFYGSKGWVAAQDLKAGDSIAVFPGPDAIQEISSRRDLILARLAGLLFTDGTLYYQARNHYWEASFTLGQEKDVADLRRDLQGLGFANVSVAELTKHQEISGRKFITHVYKVKCLSKELFGLMKSLGVPVGAKKSQRYSIPVWIKSGNLTIKREFLRGFLGGDGPKVDIKMVSRENGLPYNRININDLEFHKNANLEKSGLKLAEEISGLLGDFGVTVGKIFAEKDSYIRQGGQRSSIVHISFKKDFETALNLVSKIGYAYCHQKEQTSQIAGEFLRRIFVLRNQWQDLYQKAMELAAGGWGYRRISRELGITPLRAFMWIKKKARATVLKHKIKFNEWLAEAQKGAPAGFIWEQVVGVRPVFLPAVAKITVDQTSSFITNGILSHNCGPCKLIDPILDELATQYSGKITVGSLDVDVNQQTAAKYGVMSIPTLIFFRNGVPVKQSVGYQDKPSLQKQFDEVLAS